MFMTKAYTVHRQLISNRNLTLQLKDTKAKTWENDKETDISNFI